MFDIAKYLYRHSLYYLAFRDSLTDCLNRNYYEKKFFNKYCKKDCYIVFVDINNLKYINDNDGHFAGDESIKSVAKILKKFDRNVMRVGGDEFVLTICSNEQKQKFENDFLLTSDFSFGIEKKRKI